jgi:hypothetical protein
MYTKVINDLNGRTVGATQIGQSGSAAAIAGLAMTSANGFTAGTAYEPSGACTLANVGSSAAAPLQVNAGTGAAAYVYITATSVGATPTALTNASTKADVDAYENAVAAKAINLSRNADIAAATRKYIATVCTDFYVSDGALGASGLPAIDSTAATKYQGLYFPDVTTSATAVGRINAVTPFIKKWLPFWVQRAAIFTVTDAGRDNTPGKELLKPPTSATVGDLGSVSSSSIVAMSAATGANTSKAMTTGATDPSGLNKAPADDASATGTMQAMKNWHLARMYGAYSCWYLMDNGNAAGGSAHAATISSIGVSTAYTSGASGTLTWG